VKAWFSRFRRRRVHAEAQIDYRDGLLEARAERIAELERANARLTAELATYKTRDFMQQALRLRRRQADSPTVILPRRHW
jgi:anti-sigma factor RsiW